MLNAFASGKRYRRRGGVAPRELALVAAAGFCLGLLYDRPGSAPASPAPVAAVAPPHADPWAESRRSKAILDAQQAAPPSAMRFAPSARGDGDEVASPAGLRVVDGDTFWIGGEKVRVADIDAPETHPPRCAYEADLGARATRRLAVLLAAGPFALEPVDRDTDRYGRKLRIVTRGGQSLGGILVAEGLARPWIGHRDPWCV